MMEGQFFSQAHLDLQFHRHEPSLPIHCKELHKGLLDESRISVFDPRKPTCLQCIAETTAHCGASRSIPYGARDSMSEISMPAMCAMIEKENVVKGCVGRMTVIDLGQVWLLIDGAGAQQYVTTLRGRAITRQDHRHS